MKKPHSERPPQWPLGYTTYNNLLLRYYQDVGGHGLYNMLAQYTETDGKDPGNATLAGSWVDTNTSFPTIPTEQSIKDEIQNAIQHNGWPSSGIHNYYVVHTGSGFSISGDGCGYHNFDQFNKTIYGAVFYPSGGCLINLVSGTPGPSPNNCLECDSAITWAAHEQFEAATDPFQTGWIGGSGPTNEIGDTCQLPDQHPYGTPTYDTGQANQKWYPPVTPSPNTTRHQTII